MAAITFARKWYDPTFDVGQPAIVGYWANFVGYRSELNREKMKQRLMASDPSQWDDEIREIRKNIAELTQIQARIRQGDSQAYGRWVSDRERAQGALAKAQEDARGRLGAASMQYALGLEELESEERREMLGRLDVSPDTIKTADTAIREANEDLENGRDSSANQRIQTAINERIAAEGVGVNSPEADAIRYEFWSRSSGALQQRIASDVFGGSDPQVYMEREYGPRTEAEREARYRRVLGAGGGARSSLPAPASGAVGTGAGGGAGQPDTSTGATQFQRASAGSIDAIQAQIDAATADLQDLQARREQARNLRSSGQYLSETSNPLLAPVYTRRHRNQDIVDRLAVADPVAVRETLLDLGAAGGDPRKVNQLPHRSTVIDGELLQGNQSRQFDSMTPAYAGGPIFEHYASELALAQQEMAVEESKGEGLARLSRLVEFAAAAPPTMRDAAPGFFDDLDGVFADTIAAMGGGPREVRDANYGQPGGNFIYRQHADGQLELLTNGAGEPFDSPQPVAPGSPAARAITQQIGRHPSQGGAGVPTQALASLSEQAQVITNAGDLHYGTVLGTEINEALRLEDDRAKVERLNELTAFTDLTPGAIGGELSRAYSDAVQQRLNNGDGAGLRRDVMELMGAAFEGADYVDRERAAYDAIKDQTEAARIAGGLSGTTASTDGVPTDETTIEPVRGSSPATPSVPGTVRATGTAADRLTDASNEIDSISDQINANRAEIDRLNEQMDAAEPPSKTEEGKTRPVQPQTLDDRIEQLSSLPSRTQRQQEELERLREIANLPDAEQRYNEYPRQYALPDEEVNRLRTQIEQIQAENAALTEQRIRLQNFLDKPARQALPAGTDAAWQSPSAEAQEARKDMLAAGATYKPAYRGGKKVAEGDEQFGYSELVREAAEEASQGEVDDSLPEVEIAPAADTVEQSRVEPPSSRGAPANVPAQPVPTSITTSPDVGESLIEQAAEPRESDVQSLEALDAIAAAVQQSGLVTPEQARVLTVLSQSQDPDVRSGVAELLGSLESPQDEPMTGPMPDDTGTPPSADAADTGRRP